MRRSLFFPLAAAAALGAAVALRPTTYEIAERSMEPALHAGDWVVALRSPGRVRVGDVVVFEHPGRPGFALVKRVAALEGDPAPDGTIIGPGAAWMAGDNVEAGSVDSAAFGPVAVASIAGRVVARYRPWPPAAIARR